MKGSHAILYIITVLLLSWIVQIVLFLGILPGKWLIFYMYVPALTAFFFFFIDRKPFSDQIKLFARRISLWSLVFAFGYPIFWLGIVVLMGYVTGLGQINFSFLPALMSFSFWGVFGLTLLTGLPSMFGEEYGWRGYLLPALAEKRNLLASTLILGAVWGLWHLPSYYIIYSKIGIGNPFLLTILGMITVAVGAFPYTYCFYLTRNIIPCVILHGVYDLAAGHLFFGTPAMNGLSPEVPGILTIYWPYAQVLLIITGLMFAFLFARKFSA